MTEPVTVPSGVRYDADVLAAGAVLWRRGNDGVQVALVHRPRYDDWSHPKGKLDSGETMPFAAVREVREETGFTPQLGNSLGQVRYSVPDGRKIVAYWSAEALDGAFVPNAETDELRWCAPRDAAELLSYPHDVAVLQRFVEIGVPSALLLLVRHAKAGSRTDWDEDDDLRPLSARGRDQARKLAQFLALFGPDRVHSAVPVRCRQTVEPLSARLGGMEIVDEPLLGEEGYWEDPAAGLARLHELAALPGVTVLCSQGGVIPDVVETLAATLSRADVGPDVRSRKASTWVLGMRDGDLVAADYEPDPSG